MPKRHGNQGFNFEPLVCAHLLKSSRENHRVQERQYAKWSLAGKNWGTILGLGHNGRLDGVNMVLRRTW